MTSSQEKAQIARAEREFIVALALGPVGGFIAGGRRSRDLWYASRLLSEMTRQAVESLKRSGRATLLIPAEDSLPAFWGKPHRGPVITNKILAKVRATDQAEVERCLHEARSAVRWFLAGEVEALRKDARWIGRIGVDKKALAAQGQAILIDGDFVEFYAAWAPVGLEQDKAEAEKVAVKHARDVLLAGRKSARVFPAPTWTRPGRRKCSLDPGRDTAMVELDPADQPLEAAETLIERMEAGIRGDERLDAIGLLRRRAAFEEARLADANLPKLPFPPLSRVAADPWLVGADGSMRRDLEEVVGVLEQLGRRRGDDNPLFLVSSPCREPTKELYESGIFPFDPSLLFENGIQALLRQIDHKVLKAFDSPSVAVTQAERWKPAVTALNRLREPVRRLHKRLGFPSPYYAMIEADGDDMGRILGELVGEERRRAVEALGAFAKDAWQQVDRHHGFAFYVGGDELMAYVPVDKALELVAAVAGLFQRKMRESGVSSDAKCPTLSAGVVIVHQKEDMRAVRGWASAALREAKNLRRAAQAGSEALDTGGGRTEARTGWVCVEERPAGGAASRTADPIEKMGEHLEQWRELIASFGNDRDLSLATAHGLLEWAERFAPRREGDTTGLSIAQASVCQKLKRRDRECKDSPWLARLLNADSWQDIRRLANEILLADRIADVAAQRGLGRERTQ